MHVVIPPTLPTGLGLLCSTSDRLGNEHFVLQIKQFLGLCGYKAEGLRSALTGAIELEGLAPSPEAPGSQELLPPAPVPHRAQLSTSRGVC